MQSTTQKTKATLPNPLGEVDEVIERHTNLLAKIESMIRFKRAKYEGASGKIVDHTGNNFRSTFAREAAERYEELRALEIRERELKRKYEEAKSDLPRRQRIRARMQKISDDHDAAEKKIREHKRKIAELESNIVNLRERHDTLSIKAVNTPSELKNRGIFDPEPGAL